jgi:hypothetical protein
MRPPDDNVRKIKPKHVKNVLPSSEHPQVIRNPRFKKPERVGRLL